ncbi:MAG: ATP-binding protein [Eubacteriales bacterium]
MQCVREKSLLSKYFQFMLKYIICFLLSAVIAYLLFICTWNKYPFYAHTSIEFTFAFMSLTVTLAMFITHKYDLTISPILGFGGLCIATLNLLHIYLFMTSDNANHIMTLSWLYSRLIESLILYVCTFKVKSLNLKIWFLFAGFYISTILLFVFLFAYPNDWLISLSIKMEAFTLFNTIANCIIIFIYFCSIYRIYGLRKNKTVHFHKELLLSMSLLISTQICFSFTLDLTSFLSVLGHVLKTTAYLLLFKSFFVGFIVYPYHILKRSQLELNEILSGLPLGLINYNELNNITFANRHVLQFFNCTMEEIKGLTPNGLLDKLRIKRHKYYESNDFDVARYQCPNGSVIDLQMTSYAYHGGSIQTFSEVKTEQTFGNFKLQTQTILDAIKNPVIIFDEHSRIINCNQSAVHFFEMETDEILGLYFDEFKEQLHFSHEENTNEEDNKQSSMPLKAVINTKENNVKHLLFHYSPIYNIQRESIGYIMASTDITHMEANEERLKQQEKMALIGEMGSGIVHEAKNYLALINGYCELILFQSRDNKDQETIHKIITAANDLNGVITEFLSLAKPSELVMDILSLNEIILSLDYMFSNTSFMNRTCVELHLMENDPEILGDESQIKQVLLNIIKNAVEAMVDVDKPILTIITRTNANSHSDFIEVIIQDNGKGISKEHKDKIGTPFFTTKRNGTGLGLSICYKMIQEHNGSICLKSRVGLGTTFIIKLPIYKEEYATIEA